jgi:hypothetical protein
MYTFLPQVVVNIISTMIYLLYPMKLTKVKITSPKPVSVRISHCSRVT